MCRYWPFCKKSKQKQNKTKPWSTLISCSNKKSFDTRKKTSHIFVFIKLWDLNSTLLYNLIVYSLIFLSFSIWDLLECYFICLPKTYATLPEMFWVLQSLSSLSPVYCPLLCSKKWAYFPQDTKRWQTELKWLEGISGHIAADIKGHPIYLRWSLTMRAIKKKKKKKRFWDACCPGPDRFLPTDFCLLFALILMCI